MQMLNLECMDCSKSVQCSDAQGLSDCFGRSVWKTRGLTRQLCGSVTW